MPLTRNTLPFNPPSQIAPFDRDLCFATNGTFQTLTATGYLGAPAQLDLGPGLVEGYWAILMSALDQVTGDEAYNFHLMGSNDVAWGNTNIELLQMQNFGGASGRGIATIPGATLAIPPTGAGGQLNVFPFINMKGGVVYRYLRAYLVAAGTTPSVTVNSWLAVK